MVQDPIAIAISLLQLIALALPAVGILLQVFNEYKPGDHKATRIAKGTHTEFLLARWSFIPLLFSALLLLSYLFVYISFGQQLRVLLLSTILVIGVAFVLLGASIWFMGTGGLRESVKDVYWYVRMRLK